MEIFSPPASGGNTTKPRISLSPGDLSDQIMEWTEDQAPIEKTCEKGKEASLSWMRTPLEEKKTFFLKLKAVFQEKARKLAEMIARETGKPPLGSQGGGALIGRKGGYHPPGILKNSSRK